MTRPHGEPGLRVSVLPRPVAPGAGAVATGGGDLSLWHYFTSRCVVSILVRGVV